MKGLAIRKLRRGEHGEALAVLNEAAKAYKEVLPPEAYHEPQMTWEEFRSEAGRIVFLVAEAGGRLVGIMGYEYVGGVTLVRHGYIRPGYKRRGLGSALLREIETKILQEGRTKDLVVGMYRDAYWAVSFWSKHGFRLAEDSEGLLTRYYDLPEVQRRSSVAMTKRI